MKSIFDDELKKQQARFFSLVNGLLAITYVAGAVFLFVQLVNQVF